MSGITFSIFACLFIITYVIFNHYVNIDQIKLPTLDKLSEMATGSGLIGPDTEAKYLNRNKSRKPEAIPVETLKAEPTFYNFISSSNTQLEFFTLIGIIFNALMQGYVCVNSIYVYLIQNLEDDPFRITTENSDDFEINQKPSESKPTKSIQKQLFEFHQERINRVLGGIAAQKRKEAKLRFKYNQTIKQIYVEISQDKVDKDVQGAAVANASYLRRFFTGATTLL